MKIRTDIDWRIGVYPSGSVWVKNDYGYAMTVHAGCELDALELPYQVKDHIRLALNRNIYEGRASLDATSYDYASNTTTLTIKIKGDRSPVLRSDAVDVDIKWSCE